MPAAGGPYVVDVTPEKAGWGYSSLRVLELPPGGTHTVQIAEAAALDAIAAHAVLVSGHWPGGHRRC